MKQKIFIAAIILALIVGGRSTLSNFLPNHAYYSSMFASASNRRLLIRGLISAAIPLLYIIYNKNVTLKKTIIALTVGLLLYSIAFVSIKDDMINAAGFVILLVNVLIIFALGLYSIVSRTAVGSIIMEKIIKIPTARWQDMLLAFGLGLGAMMVVVNLCIIAHIFYPIIARALFIIGGYAIRQQRNTSLKQYTAVCEDIVKNFHKSVVNQQRRGWVGIILLGLSIVYFYYGFQLSFIPYSTARDANHAYMYIPKVRAENHGALGYGNPGGAGGVLRQSYITFFFSLIQPIKSWFWLSPDNIAVSMNFLSAIFVLIFGIGLIKEFIAYIVSILPKAKTELLHTIGLYGGWIGLLLRLTSGMGAFLVFVDNKTDMGVLALTVLAMLSGIIFIRYIHEHKNKDRTNQQMITKYIILSGLFFGLAAAAKPTAFIDIVIFGLWVVALWINSGVSLGLGLIVIGILAKLQPLYTAEFMSPSAFWPFIIAGLLVIVGSMLVYRKNKTTHIQSIKHTMRTLCIRGLSIALLVLVVKGPYITITNIQSHTLNIKQLMNGLLVGYAPDATTKNVLMATIQSEQVAQQQDSIDNKVSLPPALCSLESLGLKAEDLDKETKGFVGGGGGLSEDVGRYVGFGWKEFSHGLGYTLMRIIFPQNNTCYGWNTTAKVLCNAENEINNFDVQAIQGLTDKLSLTSEGYKLIKNALDDPKLQEMIQSKTFNPVQMRDHIVSIRQRYQRNSIKTRDTSIMVPYRYIVPRNAIFNWSLQNLSSYYTDIGFIRGIIILLQIIGLVYALVQWNNKLITIMMVSFVGWIVRWMIGGGIIRYGIGLIIWTILAASAFFVTLLHDSDDDENGQTGWYIVLGLLVLWAAIQLCMNFIRISSQGGGGPFTRYKMSAGNQQTIEDTLGTKTEIKIPYKWQDVLDLQFGHYNKFIEHVKDRPDTDGVSIAGTYLQYFLHNQHHVGAADIYRLTSDGNTCKSYLRFKKENWKYLVIDPNILSVVMGEGNESLMQRFFARRDGVTGRIDEDGEMTMLVRMWYDGYISVYNTNNLGAKYAFSLPDSVLSGAFNLTNKDDLVFLRAKMSVARFFPDAQQIINFVANTFVQRIGNGQAIGDVADVFGKTIDENKLLTVVQKVIEKMGNPTEIKAIVDPLTQDERYVLAQYLGLYNMLRQNNPQFQDVLNQLLAQSVGGSSQMIVFELK